MFSGWATVARDPRAFLSLGLCSATWLERSLKRLVQVEAEADVSGESFLHLDARSDNLCFDGPRTLLVDWNLVAMRAHLAAHVTQAIPPLGLSRGRSRPTRPSCTLTTWHS